MKAQRISIIGSGKVAQVLGAALRESGHEIVEVAGRNSEAVPSLAAQLGARPVNDFGKINPRQQCYIIAVADDAIPEVVQQLPHLSGVVVHTSGTLNSRCLMEKFDQWGIFYPLQTFSPGRMPDFNKIPFIISGGSEATETYLRDLAASIGSSSQLMNDDQRRHLHLAAVMVNNFTNHLMVLAQEYLSKQGLPPNVLDALMVETVAKALALGPANAQTGPALRGDAGTIRRHLELLNNAGRHDLATLYEMFSVSIQARNKK